MPVSITITCSNENGHRYGGEEIKDGADCFCQKCWDVKVSEVEELKSKVENLEQEAEEKDNKILDLERQLIAAGKI